MVYKLILGLLFVTTTLLADFNFNDMKTLKAEFTQTIKNEAGKVIQYTGVIYIKDNKKVLWQYLTPIKKNVYVLDKEVIIDEPELEQAIYTHLDKNIDITTLLSNAVKVSADLYKTKLYDVEYFLEIKDQKINKISFKDGLSNSIEIDFKNVDTKDELDDTLFVFLPSNSYDIIEKY
ncbi:LolA-like outer membrane lipoprotein chaperone [Halarcobacter ebronensis]|uniref:Cell envelope biogenesis protein LolA n=1 Tax=Halarcobacter ebronensis TaxID=1462615 RepID=A0A4Q1ANL3_9BACT|nr:LolA-like outer membrane lipoprotein chaperone [Halarcobacter ebronensis]QKF82242.1 periplasmic outer membrane-specific lipoprotein chaperone [Halarcobacter ebronensis]RXK07724.1 cell envelope biogenesis protein LolA [Halarcobacter ebronensis]